MSKTSNTSARSTQAVSFGKQVYLRHPRETDHRGFVAVMQPSRGLHRPFVQPPLSRERWKRYLARLKDGHHEGFLVCRRHDHAIVGVINLNEIIFGQLKCAFLGYYAAKQHAGRGLMSEGMQLVLRYAFRTMRLHRLEANIQPTNLRSIAFAKRSGFRKEGLSLRYVKIAGRWRDHERWAITVEEWRERRSRS